MAAPDAEATLERRRAALREFADARRTETGS